MGQVDPRPETKAELRDRIAVLKRSLRAAAFRFDRLALHTNDDDTHRWATRWAQDAKEKAKG